MEIRYQEYDKADPRNKSIILVEVIVPLLNSLDVAIRWGWLGFDLYQTRFSYTLLFGCAEISVSKNA